MRILHWSDSFWPRTSGIGGIQVWLMQLCRAQVAAGHEVAVATWPFDDQPAEEQVDGIRIYRWGVSDTELVASPGRLREIVRRAEEVQESFRPDVLHSHFNRLASWFNALSGEAAPTVLTMHVPVDAPQVSALVQRRVLEHASAIAAVSIDVLAQLAERYPHLQPRARVMHGGLAWPELPGSALDFGAPALLCLGRLVEEKGFDLALRALALLKRPHVKMIIVGDGNAAAGLKLLAEQAGVGKQVEFRGWVSPDDVPALINEATIVVMPSRWREPFGMVALQAAQMGRPVVATAVGGIPDVVLNGQTGILVPANSPGALAGALLDLLENGDRARAMGAHAQQRAREHFTMGPCAARYENLYRELSEAGRG